MPRYKDCKKIAKLKANYLKLNEKALKTIKGLHDENAMLKANLDTQREVRNILEARLDEQIKSPIRCHECKYGWDGLMAGWECTHPDKFLCGLGIRPNDFCSLAEPKECENQ